MAALGYSPIVAIELSLTGKATDMLDKPAATHSPKAA